MSATKPMTTFELLRQRVPDSLIKSRKQGGANLNYVAWYNVCDLLDDRAPGWTATIKQVGDMGGKIFVIVALTIEGVTRENIGYEDEDNKGYGDPFSNAYSMAIRRAAALFGVARHLYDKEDKSRGQQSYEPRRYEQDEQSSSPVAKTMADLVTPKQLVAIRSIANAQKRNADEVCMAKLNCRPEELSRRGASDFIEWLKKEAVAAITLDESQARKIKGQSLAANGNVIRDHDGFRVTDQGHSYFVRRNEAQFVICDCPVFSAGFEQSEKFRCAHIFAVKFYLEPESENA